MRCALAVILAACTAAPSARAQVAITDPPDPLDPARAGRLSLEELMSLEITSVAGLQQQVLRTPAAIDVITSEDLRRTGHRHIAEALRLSPGVYVGQSRSHSWAISPRGFNGVLANKTLVLEDGRRLYDPLHGGTFWDVQNPLLEDVDRIEVIRGPGPTLWGSNAINGVINIVNKSTKDTQGLFLEGGVGTPWMKSFGSARYGGQFSENAWYSVWGTYFDRGPLELAGPEDGGDEWDMARGRFRTDIELDDDLDFMFQVDAYDAPRHHQRSSLPVPATLPTREDFNFDNHIRGGHVMARLERMTSRNEGWTVLGYYDRTEREASGLFVVRDSFEIDARYHFTLGDAHALSTGIEFFYTSGRADSTDVLIADPESRRESTVSAFIQDTITLSPDRWFAMLGARFEYNDRSGFEVMPSARLWYTPDGHQTFWGAISRPVRIPSLAETDLIYTLFYADPGALAGGEPTGTIQPFRFSGNRDLDTEKVLAYELGYRNQITEKLAIDIAAFYNDYTDLISIPTSLPGGQFNNDGSADTWGGEIALTWRPAENWRLRGSYSYVEIDIHGPVDQSEERNTPHSQADLRSYLDLTDTIELNAAAYYVGEVPQRDIDPYVRLDLGLTFHITPKFDLSIWGQNLLEPTHREFSDFQVERGVYVAGAIRF